MPRSTSTDRERHWWQILDQWKRSGLNGRAFCRREHLKESAFFFWKRQFRLRRLTPAAKVRFVPLKLSSKPLGFFDVTLAGGRSIRVASDFDPAALARLVEVLEGRSPFAKATGDEAC